MNLNLFTIRFPCTAIASILHRASGVLIFLAIPALIAVLQKTLNSAADFQGMMTCLHHPMMRFGTWAILAALTYHLLAGIRHLLADFGWGEHLKTARLSAYGMFLLAAILIAWEGLWLWS